MGPESEPPTLHLLCGKIAAGKSTLARDLARQPGRILISEDDWLAQLYPEEIRTVEDYLRCARRLGRVMSGHLEALLGAGLSVVLDFPANTAGQRDRLRGILDRAGAAHCLHFLDVPDRICKARLKARNAAGEHAFATSEADYDRIASYFEPPSEREGFEVIRYRAPENAGSERHR